jgi:hypothetical protein
MSTNSIEFDEGGMSGAYTSSLSAGKFTGVSDGWPASAQTAKVSFPPGNLYYFDWHL